MDTNSNRELWPVYLTSPRRWSARVERVRKGVVSRWRRFWLGQGGAGFKGRTATRLGSIGVSKYRGLIPLASIHPKGYIDPSAEIIQVDLRLGEHVFIGERVVIARWWGEGYVQLDERVELNRETILELHKGGSITIGAGSYIQPRCLITSAEQPISIGRRALIASQCAFYSYNHGISAGSRIVDQPLVSRGPIVVEDDVWLGVGVKVMENVTIGAGAVVAAGSVVTRSIPAGAIAGGVPARVLKFRKD